MKGGLITLQIAIISSALSGRGGMETVFKNTYSLVQNTELSVKFIFTDGVKKTEYLDNFNKSDYFYHSHHNIFSECFFLIRVLRSQSFDCIIATSKKTLILTHYILLLLGLKIPLVSWIHFPVSKDGMDIDLSKYGDAHFAISKRIYQQIKNKGVIDSNIYYLPNFVWKSDKTIGSSDTPKYVYVGRVQFLEQKNLKELIDGITRLDDDWSIDIYGAGQGVSKCQEYIRQKYPDYSGRFCWKGWSNDPWVDIHEATALVLTSKTEGMPMTLLESISHGLPVVSADCPTGPADIIQPGINGYLYQMGNIQELADDLNKIYKDTLDRDNVKRSIFQFNDDAYFQTLLSDLNKIIKCYQHQ